MNLLITGIVGALVAAIVSVAGANSYGGDPAPVSEDKLYDYASQ